MHSKFTRNPDGTYSAVVTKRGRDVLRDPLINKGSAFPLSERAALGIEGLQPFGVVAMSEQKQRVREALSRLHHPLSQYVELADLQDRNETLFYALLVDNLQDLMPIVYTPTVGEASRNYSHIFRRGRGRWITPDHRGRIAEILSVIKADIRLIVVTDNERILGLGDLGAGGMAIPIGKLALYTAAAGIHPTKVLPISLDVGTDNARLLNDPGYVGWRQPRMRGAEYTDMLEEFVEAVRQCFPNALLQWEDFKKANAFDLLAKYRDRLPSFNDDIQGTAGVAVAGIMAACRAAGTPLTSQRIVILGAGAAGVGIAHLLRDLLAREGLSGDALIEALAVLDSGGLLLEGRDFGDEYKNEFAWPVAAAERFGLAADPPPDLAKLVAAYKPTVLIGTTGQPGAFGEAVVREMARHVERPAIFPFSNPTSKSEAKPADLLEWTEGRALIATGSPFDPVVVGSQQVRIAQGNNVYIFPGIGLGALAVSARRITDPMFSVAAHTLAGMVTEQDLAVGALYPPLHTLRAVTREIAIAVARSAIADGVADAPAEGVEKAVEDWIWHPAYPTLTVA